MMSTGNTDSSWLDSVANAIKNRHQPGGLWRKLLRLIRWGIIAGNCFYGAGLIVLLIITTWVGERWWLSAFCLYVPAQIWLLPLILLTPLTLVISRKWLLLHLGCIFLVAFGFYSFRWSFNRAPKAPVLKVMTNNYGQNGRHGFTPFLKDENPDIIALQELPGGTATRLARAYTNYHSAGLVEFVLLSKYPIRKSGPVPVYDARGMPVAAWFEVDFQGQTVIIYSVHLPSPRRELFRLRGLGMLVALAGVGQEETRPGKYREQIAESWAARVELARKLADYLRQEKRPFIVAGDFNMPERGYIYRLFKDDFQDAFARRGSGYGLTFPGYSHSPLTLFGPWLRIDYLFAGKGFKPVYCHTESGRQSQHRALAAWFEMAD